MPPPPPAAVFFLQRNFAVGDIAGNAAKLAQGAQAAAAAGAAVALAPELALTGYPPEDLLYDPDHRRRCAAAAAALTAALPPGIALVAGLPLWEEDRVYNAAAVLRAGAAPLYHRKTRLPNTSVFDEKRYFAPHPNPPLVFQTRGTRYAVQICQEIWEADHLPTLAQTGADAILVPNASPFELGKQHRRHAAAAACARACAAPVYYANVAGGQDELVFDGASFATDARGALAAQLPAFADHTAAATAIHPYPDDPTAARAAIVTGLRDYYHKSGFAEGIVLGLSGGVDSALTAVLAAAAVGPANVLAVQMPTRHTSRASLQDAEQLSRNLGIDYLTLPITAAVSAAAAATAPHLLARPDDLSAENRQARMRGLLLMALANNRDLLLLATGNKSELACGYATLYGDMNGGYAPLKDLLKTQVWALCRHHNARHADQGAIPPRIIDRPPSAELRDNQTDQQSLPPYEQLDPLIQDHLARHPQAYIDKKHGAAMAADFRRRLQRSEYKRRQAPPGPRLSACAFGKDWRMPIASAHPLP